MASIYDIPTNELIEMAADELKKLDGIKAPEWTSYVKTGAHKERPPVRNDWWYVRAASVMRTIYRLGPIGVAKLRTKYGGKKNRGMKPERFYRGSGSIARKIVQQLESEGFVKYEKKGVHKGRIIAPKGKSFLDKIATKILATKPRIKQTERRESPKPKGKKVAEKKHEEIKKEKTPEKKETKKKDIVAKKKKEAVKKEKPAKNLPGKSE